MGLRPKASDKGPNSSCPNPSPKKIMVISNWLSLGFSTLKALPMSGKAGRSASMDKATIDIKEAIKATNSSFKGCCFCMRQK